MRLPAPRVLLKQVHDTAPWLRNSPVAGLDTKPTRPLAPLADAPHGWWSILTAARGWQRIERGDESEHLDYFVLALACHHATVATVVPTDVDSKIRDHLWRFASSQRLLGKMVDASLAMRRWDLTTCSNRYLQIGDQFISGHDGEHLSVLIGGIGRLAALQLDDVATALAAVVEAEIVREAELWRGDHDPVTRGKLAMILSHNGGDIDQGLATWRDLPLLAPWCQAWQGLAKARNGDDRYGGAYAAAVALYRQGLSAEAHRHYPLRAMPALRRQRELSMPFPPFLDDWGATLATHPELTDDDRIDLLGSLIEACDKVAGQRGYQRAIGGLLRALPEPDRILRYLPPVQVARLRSGGDLHAALVQSFAGLLKDVGLG